MSKSNNVQVLCLNHRIKLWKNLHYSSTSNDRPLLVFTRGDFSSLNTQFLFAIENGISSWKIPKSSFFIFDSFLPCGFFNCSNEKPGVAPETQVGPEWVCAWQKQMWDDPADLPDAIVRFKTSDSCTNPLAVTILEKNVSLHAEKLFRSSTTLWPVLLFFWLAIQTLVLTFPSVPQPKYYQQG